MARGQIEESSKLLLEAFISKGPYSVLPSKTKSSNSDKKLKELGFSKLCAMGTEEAPTTGKPNEGEEEENLGTQADFPRTSP